MRAPLIVSLAACLVSCSVDPATDRNPDLDTAAASSAPITCTWSGSSLRVQNGRYRATLTADGSLQIDELVGGKPGRRLVSHDRLIVGGVEILDARSITRDRCRAYHARVVVSGRHPSLPLEVRRVFEFTRSMNVFELAEVRATGPATVPIDWRLETADNAQMIAYSSTPDLVVEHPGAPLGGLSYSLAGARSQSTPQPGGATDWRRTMNLAIPTGRVLLANQVIQLDGSPTNRLDFSAYQYVTHPLYSGYGLERHDDAGLTSFVDWNSYKYAMEDLGPVAAAPGSGLAEDSLIRLGVHLVERLASDGGWFRYPAWSIYPDGDSFTTSGRCLPVLAYLWAHLAVTDTGTGFVHQPGDHDEIYDQLQQTFAFIDPDAPEPTFADRRSGTGYDYLSYSLALKEVTGNFPSAVINSHAEALHFAAIMKEAAELRGRVTDADGWRRAIDAYFPGTRQLFADLYPGEQDGQVHPGLINYSTSAANIYNTDPSIDYPSITFEDLAGVYLQRGEYEIEFADVVERYGRGDTFPFDDLFEPIEQVGLLNAMWRVFPPSLALSFSDEAPPRRFDASRWDSWTMHPHVHTMTGDFDGDGRSDALKLDVREDGGQSAAGRVWVGLARDGGGFQTGGPWATWTTYAAMKLAVGDFDGDGDDDLMKLDYPLGGGTALRGLWVGLSTGSSFVNDHWGDWQTNSRTRLLTGDFNCDEKADVMMVEVRADGGQMPDGELRVALSTGTGFDTGRPAWAEWTTHDRMWFGVGDFDGDGCDDIMKVDVASDGSAATSNLWVGLSRHQPGAPPLDGWSFSTGGPWSSWTTTGATRFATGDFDGDGRTDVLVVDIGGAAGPNGLFVARSTGSAFSIRRWATWYTDERMKVLTGDFDGNGKTDVMKLDVDPGGATARGGLWVGVSDGYELSTRQWDRWDTYPSMKVMAGDFDGDGIDDVMKADVSSPGSWLGLWVGLSRAAPHDPIRASNPGSVGLAEIVRHGPGRAPTVHDPSLYIVERGGRRIIRTSTRIYTTWTPGFFEEKPGSALTNQQTFQIVLAPHTNQQMGHYGAVFTAEGGGPRVELMTDFSAADSWITPPAGFSRFELDVRDHDGSGWGPPRFVASGSFAGFVHIGPLAPRSLVILHLSP